MVVDGVFFFLLYIIYFFWKWRQKELFFHTLVSMYLVTVFLLTLSPFFTSLTSIFSHRYEPMMLEPFRDFLAGYEFADWQIILNIMMFIPFGFLLPRIRNYKGYQVVFVSFLLSTAIELIQPLISSYRCSDITDVICNTLGGFIGYILYKIVQRKK